MVNKRKLANGRKLSLKPQALKHPLTQSTDEVISRSSLAILVIGFLSMASYGFPLYFTYYANQIEKSEINVNTNNSSSDDETIKLVHFFGLTQYQMEFGQLKPILSAVMQMVSFCFFCSDKSFC